jgi:hypothetical protein
MLWAVSRAPLAKLQAYKRRMGWTFPGRPRARASIGPFSWSHAAPPALALGLHQPHVAAERVANDSTRIHSATGRDIDRPGRRGLGHDRGLRPRRRRRGAGSDGLHAHRWRGAR